MLSFFHSVTHGNTSPMFVYAQSPIHSNVLSTQVRSRSADD
ncbi:hypothetical protein AB4483_16120 [Vibrio splendidus]